MATQMNDEYTRVTKGMVFIYDIDEDKDKNNLILQSTIAQIVLSMVVDHG